MSSFRRVIWIVLDSCGTGEMPDAAAYGDEGSDTIGNIARHGVEEVLLLAGHLAEKVEARYAGATIRGARVDVIHEPQAGTAGALLYAKDRLDPVFLMLNGDCLLDINYLALAAALFSRECFADRVHPANRSHRRRHDDRIDLRLVGRLRAPERAVGRAAVGAAIAAGMDFDAVADHVAGPRIRHSQ